MTRDALYAAAMAAPRPVSAIERARALLRGEERVSSAAIPRATKDVAAQTEPLEPWEILEVPGDMSPLRETLAEVVAENERLQTALDECESLIAELMDRRETPEEQVSSSSRAPPLELGYLVLLTPSHQGHLRGHHRASWGELLNRLGLRTGQSRAGYSIRKFVTQERANDLWTSKRLCFPIPVDPR